MEVIMCRIQLSVVVITIWISQFGCAYAGDRTVDGLVLGGSGGALIGQAIGRNTEATIIGATVGGLIGLIVGSDIESNMYARQRSHRHYRSRDNYTRRHRIKENHYRFYDQRERCRETITIVRGNRYNKRVISTDCWGKTKKHHKSRNHSRNKRRHQFERYDY